MARTGYNLRISYLESNEVLRRPYQKALLALVVAAALLLPAGSSNFFVHLMNLCFLAAIGALGLMILTGYCGQISLGHAAFLAIGAYTTVILTLHLNAPFIVVVPTAAISGAIVGFIVGLPSLRFRGVYLAISTLAMHYAIIFVATTYQSNFTRSASAGITIPDPSIGPFVLKGDLKWYYFLLVVVTLVTIACVNLMRTRPGRAWMAIRDREIAAQALGINLARYKLLAFMVSSTLASMSGSLMAYYSNVVTGRGVHAGARRDLCRDDHRRRNGINPRGTNGRGLHHASALRNRYGFRVSPALVALRVDSVRRPSRRGRRLHHPVPAVRAERARRNLAAHRDLFRSLALPLSTTRYRAAVTDG